MAMDLNAKAAYIRGLMTGMEFDPASKNGKVIAAMMDLLEEMAAQVVEHDNALDQVYDELETLDQDVDDIVSDLRTTTPKRTATRACTRSPAPTAAKSPLWTRRPCWIRPRSWSAPTAMPLLTLSWKAPRTSSPRITTSK
jgi:uncharacterized coiled-coil protein SlyX